MFIESPQWTFLLLQVRVIFYYLGLVFWKAVVGVSEKFVQKLGCRGLITSQYSSKNLEFSNVNQTLIILGALNVKFSLLLIFFFSFKFYPTKIIYVSKLIATVSSIVKSLLTIEIFHCVQSQLEDYFNNFIVFTSFSFKYLFEALMKS